MSAMRLSGSTFLRAACASFGRTIPTVFAVWSMLSRESTVPETVREGGSIQSLNRYRSILGELLLAWRGVLSQISNHSRTKPLKSMRFLLDWGSHKALLCKVLSVVAGPPKPKVEGSSPSGNVESKDSRPLNLANLPVSGREAQKHVPKR